MDVALHQMELQQVLVGLAQQSSFASQGNLGPAWIGQVRQKDSFPSRLGPTDSVLYIENQVRESFLKDAGLYFRRDPLQDNFLFDGTIRENIAFARPDATDEEIREAGRIAHCDDFVDKFPKHDKALFIHADRTRIKQVLINLLSNAIKYNGAGGAVIVQCANVADDRIRINVKDTGIGMSQEQIGHLFQQLEP